ncbi:cyclic-AMP-regulated phosphoprotein family protein [Niveomyces insectorum RCEF 264]|uniref:mRNA stability protein n=1 Tax=Niveomyces insectorum RCEF 264 TaxID=1081102 RepID=A0A168AGS5_9HYPO|nr:cyclic-AMP-regulated phosphoprotein family protein [Niveomyces insectorum RCEF 264]
MALNPHQKNKIDVNSLSPEEQRLFRLYGKLPSRSDHFAKHLKDRKYFDSGDYAMSKAGKGDGVDTGTVGSQHPVPEKIPHLSSPPHPAPGTNGHNHSIVGGNGNGNGNGGGGGIGGSISSPSGVGSIALGIPNAPAGAHHHQYQQSGSPVKESSFLHNETSASDLDDAGNRSVAAKQPTPSSSTSPVGQGQTESIPIRR